jgi:hypothetical protein
MQRDVTLAWSACLRRFGDGRWQVLGWCYLLFLFANSFERTPITTRLVWSVDRRARRVDLAGAAHHVGNARLLVERPDGEAVWCRYRFMTRFPRKRLSQVQYQGDRNMQSAPPEPARRCRKCPKLDGRQAVARHWNHAISHSAAWHFDREPAHDLSRNPTYKDTWRRRCCAFLRRPATGTALRRAPTGADFVTPGSGTAREVDETIAELLPLLPTGDILIEGGNS